MPCYALESQVAKDQAVPKFRLTKKVALQKAQSKHQKTAKIYLMNFHKWNGRSSAYIKEFVNGAVYFRIGILPISKV